MPTELVMIDPTYAAEVAATETYESAIRDGATEDQARKLAEEEREFVRDQVSRAAEDED